MQPKLPWSTVEYRGVPWNSAVCRGQVQLGYAVLKTLMLDYKPMNVKNMPTGAHFGAGVKRPAPQELLPSETLAPPEA